VLIRNQSGSVERPHAKGLMGSKEDRILSLLDRITFTLESHMRRFVSTISSKGQVTIPADIRRKLGVNARDKIAFILTDDEKVEVRPVRFTLESVFGSVKALPNESLDLDREIHDATKEAVARKMRRLNRQ